MAATTRSTPSAKSAKSAKKRKAQTRKARFTAATADRHELYQYAVQNVEAEIDFVDNTYKALRGVRASRLREDFCGTGNTSCEWVRRRVRNTASGLDIDQPTLEWGRKKNLAKLTKEQRKRVRLLNRDVRTPGDAVNMDIILAMNFSYWLFMERSTMREYFGAVRESLAEGGVFFLDHFGGYDAFKEQEESREIDAGPEPFTYTWHQKRYNPITGRVDCAIHFELADGTKMRNAFKYTWRLWTLPEIREILEEAGFRKSTVYWEGTAETGDEDDDEEFVGGNGIFEPTEVGEADAGFICYIAAEK